MAESQNSRLETFCDGVFAIAITLLILEIKTPAAEEIANSKDLWEYLSHLSPSVYAFLLSFLIIGCARRLPGADAQLSRLAGPGCDLQGGEDLKDPARRLRSPHLDERIENRTRDNGHVVPHRPRLHNTVHLDLLFIKPRQQRLHAPARAHGTVHTPPTE